MKKFALLCLTIIMSSCGIAPVTTNKNIIQDQGTKTSAGVTVTNVQDKTIISLGDKGATITAKLNINTFKTKASSSGTAAKTFTDVAKVDVYLFQISGALSSVPAGSDPLATGNVSASVTNLAKTATTGSFTLTFKNVPPNTSNLEYWVGVVAKDSTNAVIAKPPATAWTGNTFTTAPALAVTTSGVTVLPDYSIDNASDLPLTIDLLDATGAQVGASATAVAGNGSVTGGTTVSLSEP